MGRSVAKSASDRSTDSCVPGHPSGTPDTKAAPQPGHSSVPLSLSLNTEKSEKSTSSGHPYKPTLGSGSSRDYRDINTSRGTPGILNNSAILQFLQFSPDYKRRSSGSPASENGSTERDKKVERKNVPTICTSWTSSSTEFCVFYVQEISRQTNRQSNKIISFPIGLFHQNPRI